MSRPAPAANPLHIRFAEFELDEANASLRRAGVAVALAPTPFNLLCALARGNGALLSKDALLDAVWGHQFVSESVLKTAVSDLRIALGDSPREPRFIETVSRRGYRFIADAAAVSAASGVAPGSSESAATAPRETTVSHTFVGRAGVVGRLHRAWQRASEGQRAVVWIAGEPGIGKTTLIEHFAAGLGGVARARGQCVEHHGAGEPYLLVLEALAQLCRADAALPALLRSVAPTWLLQLPWLGSAEERETLRRELAGVGPERMLREMGELLDRYTEQRPLLLVTEDLHWSDRATIQLIDHVARRRGRARLMWLASFRLAEVVALEHPLNALRRELRVNRLCEEVVLDPFSESEVAAWLAQRSAALARDEAFVRALHERSDGVPLFVDSIMAEVLEQGGGAGLEHRVAAAVPQNLAAIIEHHLARLGPEQRTLLAAAAVCGVAFRVETLAGALGRELADVALACDELVRGQVWLTEPRAEPGAGPGVGPGVGPGEAAPPCTFRHALFRQVLYDRTPAAVRSQLHASVGAALERERAAGLGVPAAELALHFDRGRQPMAALRHYAEAAHAALLHFSPTTCIALTERAAVLLPQAPEGAERDALEITLATLRGIASFHAHGVGDLACDAFERARALLAHVPGHPIRGRLLHGLGYLRSLRGEYAKALEVARQAEALAQGESDAALMLAAGFVQAHARHLQGQWREARSWLARGLALAEGSGAQDHEGFAADPQVALLGLQALDLLRSGSITQCREQLQRARERAEMLRQPMSRLVVAWHEALVEVRLGHVARLDALAGEMQALVDAFSLEQGRTASQWFRGWVLARQGQPREGHRLIREACDRNVQLGMRAGSSEVLGYATEALLLAGDAPAAQAALLEAKRLADELGEEVYRPQLWLLDAALARADGRPAAADERVRMAVQAARAQESPWFELQALVELGRHGPLAADERQALATLVEGLPEAHEQPEMQQARRLLAPVGLG